MKTIRWILEYWKIVSIAIAISGGAVTAVAYISKKSIENYRQNIEDSRTIAMVKRLVESDSIKNEKLDKLLNMQKEFVFEFKKANIKLDALNGSVTKHLRDENKLEDLIILLKEYNYEVKKNNELNEGTGYLILRK